MSQLSYTSYLMTRSFRRTRTSLWTEVVLILVMCNVSQTLAQKNTSSDSVTSEIIRTLSDCKITNSGFGGFVLKFSNFNDHFALMTGGRGAATINNRYTIGGGGYGIANSIDLPGSSLDTSRYFKMGYGGLELGFLFYPEKKINVGTSLLIAGGAAFLQNKPKSGGAKLFDDNFNIFPVLEPAMYSEIALNRHIRLHAGISYRYIHHAHLDYMTDKNMRGFSFFVGILFGNSK